MNPAREDGPAILPGSGEVHLPDPPPEEPLEPPRSGSDRTLLDDIEDLLLDAKTYVDAELSYQKSRASYVTGQLKKTVAFGAAAAFIGVLALIGLTIGLILCLAPLITIWGATVVVIGGMFLVVYLLLRRATRAWGEVMGAIHEDPPEDSGPAEASSAQSREA